MQGCGDPCVSDKCHSRKGWNCSFLYVTAPYIFLIPRTLFHLFAPFKTDPNSDDMDHFALLPADSAAALPLEELELNGDGWSDIARASRRRLWLTYYWLTAFGTHSHSSSTSRYCVDVPEKPMDWPQHAHQTETEPSSPRTRTTTTESDERSSQSGLDEEESSPPAAATTPSQRRDCFRRTFSSASVPSLPRSSVYSSSSSSSGRLQLLPHPTAQISHNSVVLRPASLQERSRTTSLELFLPPPSSSEQHQQQQQQQRPRHHRNNTWSSPTSLASLDSSRIPSQQDSTAIQRLRQKASSIVRHSQLSLAAAETVKKLSNKMSSGERPSMARKALESALVRDANARGWMDVEDDSESENDDGDEDYGEYCYEEEPGKDVAALPEEPAKQQIHTSSSSSYLSVPPKSHRGRVARISSAPALICRNNRRIASSSSSLSPIKRVSSSPSTNRTMKLDPHLAAVEAASRFMVKCVCTICGRVGANYPKCPRCAQTFCSRECRTNMYNNDNNDLGGGVGGGATTALTNKSLSRRVHSCELKGGDRDRDSCDGIVVRVG
jgi:hypothetical protein